MFEAMQITKENVHDVAVWCGKKIGSVQTSLGYGRYAKETFITWDSESIAVVSDWVIKTDDGKFKVVTDEEYLAILSSEEKDKERYERVLAIVKRALIDQDAATYHGNSTGVVQRAENATQQILEII